MKILFATPSVNGGGVFSYALEFINLFAESDEVYLACSNIELLSLKQLSGAYNIDCSNHSIENARRFLRIVNEVSPDVIINSNAKILPLVCPFVDDKIKIISVSHSLKYSDADNAAINNKYIDKIIALSNYGKQYLDHKYRLCKSSKVVVIPNSVNEPNNSDELREQKRAAKRVTIVFPGGCTPAKYPELALRVAKHLLETNLNFRFYWLGDTRCPLHKFSFFKDISSLFHDERIIFTGKVNREESLRIIHNANVLLFPSRREGCPISLLEAMSVGVIPIVSDFNNGNKEIITGESGFIIPHKKTKEFVNLIGQILSNPTSFDKYYYSSYQRFRSELSSKLWATRITSVINNLTDSHVNRYHTLSVIKYYYYVLKQHITFSIGLIRTYFEEGIPSFFSIHVFGIQQKLKK